MRCKGCPYESYDHQEGYSTCILFGDNEDYIYENNKGELGCKYNRKSLQKFVKRRYEREGYYKINHPLFKQFYL